MHIAELLKNRVIKPKRGTRWTDMVKECVDIINEERSGTKFRKVSFIVIRNKVEHLNDDDLAYFISICKDGKNRKYKNKEGFMVQGSFSRVFFGALKVKTDGNTGG